MIHVATLILLKILILKGNRMYKEKLENILNDVENKEIEIAGGSVVGIILATVNSLIKYISSLTLGKKKYENVQEEIKKILEEASKLKEESLNIVDKDKEILKGLLETYKNKKEDFSRYEAKCKESAEFCLKVVKIAFDTFVLSDRISKVGNKMLSSDFTICKYYSFASIQSGIVNVEINLKAIQDEEYKEKVNDKCSEILNKARSYM